MGTMLDRNFEYFLDTDFSNYREGEWVAIHKNQVISHGMQLKEVIQKAEKVAPISQVLLSKVKKTATFL